MARFKWPEGTQRLGIFADAGDAGRQAAATLSGRLDMGTFRTGSWSRCTATISTTICCAARGPRTMRNRMACEMPLGGGHPQHQFSRHRRHHRAARRYDAPTARFRPLAGILAFYARLIDEAWVGDTRVRTQDASFYGGWVTPNLDGRINGAPGTGHW